MKNMEQIGTVLLVKTSLRIVVMKPKTIYSSMKGNLPSYSTKLADYIQTLFFCHAFI